MSAATGGKKPSGAQNRKAKAARLQAALEASGALQLDYAKRLGPAPIHDPSELALWLQRVGAVMVEEALALPDMAERHKQVANSARWIGLLASKSQFAGRVEAIEKRLAELSAPRSDAKPTGPGGAGGPEATIVIPAQGTPLWRAWRARGALPAEGANVVEVPETSRAYRALAEKERTP